MILLLLSSIDKWGLLAKNLKMVSLRFFKSLISKHIKNLFRVFYEMIFKCSKINKLGTFVLPF